MREHKENDELISSAEKILVAYMMLENKQILNYETFSNIFETSTRTFSRVIHTLRVALEKSSIYEMQIIFNKKIKSYELVKLCFKHNKKSTEINQYLN